MPGAGTNSSTPAHKMALRPGCLKEASGPAGELTFPPETWAAECCGPDLGIWMPPAPRLGLDTRWPSASSESAGLALVQQVFEELWLPPPAPPTPLYPQLHHFFSGHLRCLLFQRTAENNRRFTSQRDCFRLCSYCHSSLWGPSSASDDSCPLSVQALPS